MTPIFRRMAEHPALDFHVAYCTLRGAEAGHDPEFGADIQWDVPLLDGYSWTYVPNRGSGAESFFGLFNPRMGKLIRSGNYDAVLCFIGYVRATFWIACMASKFSKAAFIFGADATSLTPRDGRNWKVPIKRFFWPRLFGLADQVIVPSSDGRDFMCTLGIPRDHVSLTGDCVDNDWWMAQSKQVDRTAVRASWGVSPNDAVIVFSAKLQQWKRPLDLLRAFARFEPSRENVLDFYAAADLYVSPTREDSFGLPVAEAMACGLPVITSMQAGVANMIHRGMDGFILRQFDNYRELALMPQRLQADEVMRKNAGDAATKAALQWTWDRNAADFWEFLRSAADRKLPSPERKV